jgi:hypothetical protein
MSIEKSNNRIGYGTRDFPACSIVPQSTTLPRASNLSERTAMKVNKILRGHLTYSRTSILHNISDTVTK